MRAQVKAIKKVGRPIITSKWSVAGSADFSRVVVVQIARSMVEIVAVHPQNIHTDFLKSNCQVSCTRRMMCRRTCRLDEMTRKHAESNRMVGMVLWGVQRCLVLTYPHIQK
jgi:hypothetical protein